MSETSPAASGSLESRIDHFFSLGPRAIGDPAVMEAFLALREGLSSGTIRSAEPDSTAPFGWRVNAWVKRGILLGFRIGEMKEMGTCTPFQRAALQSVMASGS